MGLCKICRSMIPPDMMHDNSKCQFCKKDTNELRGSEGKIYRKEDVVKDYKIFLNRLKDNEKLRNKILRNNDE